ncbi:MAG: YcxB family protein [Oscillospiraceae bacterium]|nr:YcxB family protein [Oscillospiraceae bacterium]
MEELTSESIFETHCVHTKEFIAELFIWTHFKGPSSVYTHLLWLIFLSFGLYINIYRDNVKQYQKVMLIMLPFLFLLFVFLRITRFTKSNYNHSLKINQGVPIEVRLIITEEIIFNAEYLNTERKIELPISRIMRIRKSKNLIILGTKTEQIIILTKDGFTKGTLDEFLDFITAKIAINKQRHKVVAR